MSSLIIFAVALALGLFTQPLVIRWADRHQHFDQTDDRKCHRGQISSLGGIAWFGASLLPVGFLILLEQSYFLIPLLACMLVLFGLSLWDDFRPLPALFRLGFQVILSIAIYLAGWQLPLGWLSFPATILFILLMINAYNFIDGINGLLGTISLLAFCGFGIIFSLQEQQLWALMSWSAAGGSLAFLRYNFGRSARIFMGDNGSTIIGLLLATFFLQSTKSITATQLPTIIPALVLIALPILDLVRVVLVRLKQGHSPFHADRQHFHHLFVDFGWTAPEVCRLVIRQKLVLLMFCWGIPVLGFQLLFLLGGFGGLFWFAYQQVAGTTSSPTPVQGVEKPVLLGQSTEGLRA